MIKSNLTKTGEPCLIMEVKELMIGNVLSYNNKYVHVTSLSLDIDDEYEEQIGFCNLGESSNESGGWTRNICDKLTPIPLTPEILEKCGFENKRVGGVNDNEGTWWCEPLLGFRFLFEFDKKPSSLSYGPAGITIEYLHQLQNLYSALAGKDLPVKTLNDK